MTAAQDCQDNMAFSGRVRAKALTAEHFDTDYLLVIDHTACLPSSLPSFLPSFLSSFYKKISIFLNDSKIPSEVL
jgi:hypothetical protein